MSIALTHPERLDETAVEYWHQTGHLYVVVGLVRCSRDGTNLLPAEPAGERSYECGFGHLVPASDAETAVVERFREESAPGLIRVTAPENLRNILVGCGVSALLDPFPGHPMVSSILIEHPIN